ncbi:MAG: hypothetical protein ACC656_05355, partial [Candidatus Heimdallarchaeota archaeon]
MARKSRYKWLEKIATYIHSENELFAYIGTPTNPRSSAIRIKENKVNAPVKLPPISTKSLDERHPNTANLELEDTIFSAKIKFLYAFFNRDEEIFTKTINGIDNKSIIIKTAKELKALKIDKLLDIVYRHGDFDKWFVKKKRPTPIFDSFIRVLSRPSRNSRQIALTQIVSEVTQRKELPKALLLLLLGLREELTIAIFRELGRQQKFIYPFPEIAEHYFTHTTSEEIRKYTFYYLLNQTDESIIRSSLYKNLRVKLTIFASISLSERANQIVNGLAGDLSTAKTCLIGTYGLSRSELSDLLLALYRIIGITKKHRENLRIASLYLLKLVEVAPNPELCGFIISLNTLGRSSFVYEDQKKITSIRIKDGPTEYTSKYVVRRTIKLLELWNQIGLDEYLTRALLFYINHIPPERIKIEKRRISINRRLTGEWQRSHTTLSKFGNKISSILGDDKNQLYQTIMTQSRLNNRFTLEWLDSSFRSKT